MEDDGQCSADPQSQTLRYGCPQGNAICKVVNGVAAYDEDGQGLEAADGPSPVGGTLVRITLQSCLGSSLLYNLVPLTIQKA